MNPDPLVPDDWLWDPAERAFVPRPSTLWAYVAGVVSALVIVALVFGLLLATHVVAAPRDARLPSIPVADDEHLGAPPASPQRPGQPWAHHRIRMSGGAPTPSPAATRTPPGTHSGTASWYAADGLIAAAGPGLRVGQWRGRLVTVTAGGRSVTVRLVDWCQCYGSRLIDLSDDAFRQLVPLSWGLVRVRVRT